MSLQASISEVQRLIDFSDRFFSFSLDQLLNQAIKMDDPALNQWVRWYQELYYL